MANYSFMMGDKVSYCGEKFADLRGALGVVCAPIQNAPGNFVIDFGAESIVVHESKLAPFQGHLKNDNENDSKKKKEPKVEKRRRARLDEEDED